MSKLEFNPLELLHMKLIFFLLFIISLGFTTNGQDTNKQRIDRINEIILSSMTGNYLVIEKCKIQLNGCELIYVDYLKDNTTTEEKLDLNSSEVELVKLGENPDEFDQPFWIVEVDYLQIGFDIYDETIATELHNLIIELKNNCE